MFACISRARARMAMFDGAELRKAITAHPGDTEAALAAYEEGGPAQRVGRGGCA